MLHKEEFTMKYKSLLTLCTIALTASCLYGCKKQTPEKLKLPTTSAAMQETMAEETTKATVAAETLPETTQTASQNSSGIATVTNTYTSKQISIAYPAITNLTDTAQMDNVNALLKKNALSVLDGYSINEETDTLTITCEVLSISRDRITVTYKGTLAKNGADDPSNLFYSNTVNLNTVADYGFEKFADPYTMAGYVLSDDCQFPFADAELQKKLMQAKNDRSLESYMSLFQHADFPYTDAFPECFSYEYNGEVYFSIPVSHELGDYAIVVYSPDTK